jgi:hypothetical protein
MAASGRRNTAPCSEQELLERRLKTLEFIIPFALKRRSSDELEILGEKRRGIPAQAARSQKTFHIRWDGTWWSTRGRTRTGYGRLQGVVLPKEGEKDVFYVRVFSANDASMKKISVKNYHSVWMNIRN